MAVFAYEAINVSGQRVRQEVEAKSKEDAIKLIRI